MDFGTSDTAADDLVLGNTTGGVNMELLYGQI